MSVAGTGFLLGFMKQIKMVSTPCSVTIDHIDTHCVQMFKPVRLIAVVILFACISESICFSVELVLICSAVMTFCEFLPLTIHKTTDS